MRIVIFGIMLLLAGVARINAATDIMGGDYGSDPGTEVVSVSVGQSVTFIATAVASPAPTYQWQKNGIPIFATGDTLSLPNVGAADAGSYTAIATNTAGSAISNTVALVVNGVAGGTGTPETQNPGGESTAPVITIQPVSQTAAVQSTVAFSAAASGSPMPIYQWTKNGVPISGATDTVLKIEGVTLADASRYALIASNKAGSVASNEAVLTVTYAPWFTVQPANQVAAAFTTVVFTASASGMPAPSYQWFKNGFPVIGATNANLTLQSTTQNDIGTYTVLASNSVGSAISAAAQLTMNVDPVGVAPVITQQPVDQFVTTLSGVSFSAAASGIPTPTYQWLKNGAPIAGATGTTLSFAVVNGNDAGTYALFASNSAGAAISSAATLVVSEIIDPSKTASSVPFDAISVLRWVVEGGAPLNVGFVVPGTVPKKILIRVVGPSLGAFMAEALIDPRFDVYQNEIPLAGNDNWGGGSTLIEAFNQVGAVPFIGVDSKDAALLVPLAPGGYNVTVSGGKGATGVVMVEIYEVR